MTKSAHLLKKSLMENLHFLCSERSQFIRKLTWDFNKFSSFPYQHLFIDHFEIQNKSLNKQVLRGAQQWFVLFVVLRYNPLAASAIGCSVCDPLLRCSRTAGQCFTRCPFGLVFAKRKYFRHHFHNWIIPLGIALRLTCWKAHIYNKRIIFQKSEAQNVVLTLRWDA